jgi:hypothetical protein
LKEKGQKHFTTFSHYNLNILGKDFAQKFKIESGKVFCIEKTKEVLDVLEDFAFRMNKEFIRPRENHLIYHAI